MEIDHTPSLTNLEDFRASEMDNYERMSDLTGRTVAFNGGGERRLWAVRVFLNTVAI